jgi:hypothetical protein
MAVIPRDFGLPFVAVHAFRICGAGRRLHDPARPTDPIR